MQSTPPDCERINVAMSNSIFVLVLATWVGNFWLGFQIGKGQSEYWRKRELEDLERRFRIVNSYVVEAPEA